MLPRLVIPSYNRPEFLKSKTLAFLKQSNYPIDLIIIFVASDSEKTRYAQICPGYNLVVGVPGLVAQRKFISDYISNSEIYLSLDDDITGVKSLGKSFLDIVTDGVTKIESGQAGLWGIRPNDDARGFKDSTTSHLSHIVGCLFLIRNHRDIVLSGLSETEDYERSMLYFQRYGSVFRYQGAGVQTRYAGTSSGSREGFSQRKADAVRALLLRFPGMCKYRDKSGEADLLLNFRYKLSLPITDGSTAT